MEYEDLCFAESFTEGPSAVQNAQQSPAKAGLTLQAEGAEKERQRVSEHNVATETMAGRGWQAAT